jgi:hypothetical protein
MSEEWVGQAIAHWPTLALAVFVFVAIYHGARAMATTFDTVAKALGPLGRRWQARGLVSRAEVDDLIGRVEYLDRQVKALRTRDECYFAYTLHDQDWHTRNELLARERGWVLERHITFLEFRYKWMRDRHLEDEDDLWQL